MAEYELRFLNKRGRTILIYKTICMDDERAKERISDLNNLPYARFEIWRGMEKIAEGLRAAT